MRIDIHTHIFPREVVESRNHFFENEPSFKLLYEPPTAKLATAEMLLETMDRDGVDKSVVFGFPWESRELTILNNDYVLESAARYENRLIPLGCMNPSLDWSVREAERCLESGARGLGELATYKTFDTVDTLDRYKDLVHCCREKGAILLVHANEPVGHYYPGKAPLGLDFYYALAKLATGIPLILAHWGGGLCFYELLKKEAVDVLAEVYYDTSASPFLYQPDIYNVMAKTLGKHKILFGSDYPLLPPQRYFQEMGSVNLTTAELAAITGGNAAKLLGLTGPSALKDRS